MHRRKRLKLSFIFPLLLSVLLLLTGIPSVPADAAGSSSSKAQTLTVTYLDVGQGDAAVIQYGSHTMMIDGGKPEESGFIYSWLKSDHISYIDYMVASHPDSDHVGGLSGALNEAEVGTAWCSTTEGDTKTFENFLKYLDRQGTELEVPEAGDTYSLGKAKIQILGPEKPADSEDDDTNNSSLAIKITYGDISFLFAGDAGREEEQELIDSGYDLESTVLKVDHHGSAGSTSYAFLREVNPEYAVISVGADNSYGHPTQEVLSRLRDADVKTYRTDMQGTITAVSDGKTVDFTVEKNASANTLANAGAGQKNTTSSYANADTAQKSTASSYGNADTEQTYILNKNTRKFHYPTCSSVRQMSDKNKETVHLTRDQLIEQGYQPCQRCNP